MELIVVGCQSGDEGKGKFTDMFSGDADFVVRFQGGPHTGHTVVTHDGVYQFVQLPAGILRGARAVLGNGCVVEPAKLLEEMAALGIDPHPERLLISEAAHVVMPYHRLQDEAAELWRGEALATDIRSGFTTGGGRLGSTCQGVGPCREDKVSRIGLRIVDLLDFELLRARLARLLPLKAALLERVYGMRSERLQALFDVDRLSREYHAYGRRLAPCMTDVAAVLAEARAHDRLVVYEGAQSLALDVEHGTYPYCSSGYSGAGGVTVGTGTPPNTRFVVAGVAKSYMTQVGGGPLPTELSGEVADHIVERGREIGTVTGRRRRVGWLDLAFIRRSILVEGVRHLCLTSVDVLAGLPEVQVAVHYLADGEEHYSYPARLRAAASVEPVYVKFAGWPECDWDEVAATGFHALPEQAQAYVSFASESLGVPLAAVGVGRRRDQALVVSSPISEPLATG